MSHFLEHLIARHTQPANNLKPRLPSLFEPVSSPAVFALENSVIQEPETQASASPERQETKLPEQPSPQISHPLQSDERPLKPIINSFIEKVNPFKAKTELGEPTETIIELPPNPVIVPQKETIVIPQPREPKPTTGLSIQPTVTEKMTTRLERTIEKVTTTEIQPAKVELRQPQTPLQTEIIPKERSVVSAQIQPIRQSSPLEAPAAPSPSQPTIQVTIGRIEIRATQTAAATKRSPPAPPVMSLEDYLRQRGGNR